MSDIQAPLQAALADRYVLRRELGRGGMAIVYLADDVKHDRPVALKVLHADLASSLGPDRFLREIRITARLDHPHILPVLDSGEVAGQLWYTMPYVEGESLRHRLWREGQLPIDEAIRLAREVADALDYAHRHGVIHRDIKPENILLSDGHARVADFGVARALEAAGGGQLTKTGMAVGTPVYMSPEQATAGHVDARTDQYSLACVLYELLTGEAPYTGATPQAVIAKRMLEPVPHVRTLRDSVPAAIEVVLTRALAKIPADRFPSTGEFARALESTGRTEQDSVASLPSQQGYARRGPTIRHAAIRAVPVLFVIALVIAGAFLLRDRTGSARETSLIVSPITSNPARLAVLYFHDLTGSTEYGYIADALTEALIAELSQVKGLDVVSRHGAALYRKVDLPRDSIARALQVGTLVTGSVELVADRLRVILRLVDGLSGADFERTSLELPAGTPLALRDSVVERAAELLRARLGEEVRLQERRKSTRSAAAWSLLQRAENVRKEAEALASADPAEAEARYLQADSVAALSEAEDPVWTAPTVFRSQIAYRISRFTFDPDSAGPWIERGLRHAENAFAKNKEDPSALMIRGTLRYWKWLLRLAGDPVAAATLFRDAQTDLEAATTTDPQLADAWSALSHLYMQIPDMPRAKLAAVRAYEEDTYLQGVELVLFRLFTTSFDLDQMEEATRWCKIGTTRFPDHPRFLECQLLLVTELRTASGTVDRAWRLARRLAELSPPKVRPFFRRKGELYVAMVLAKAGLRDSARRVIQRARATAKADPLQELPLYEARAYLLLGERKTALRSLESYFQAEPARKVHFSVEGWFDDLEDDPELKRLIRR